MGLISTYDVRIWLGIEEGDRKPNAKIKSIAGAVEAFCDSYTGRKLEAKRYLTDPQFSYYDGKGGAEIYVDNHPVSYVSSVHVDGNKVFGSATLVASADMYWYPSGQVRIANGSFYNGHRNVLIDYIGGYAPVVGNTHNMAVSTYPLPLDLKQVMLEMVAESFKEGVSAVHTVAGKEGDVKFLMMLNKNTHWTITLNKFKDYSVGL